MTTLITGAGLIAAYAASELQRRGEAVILYDLAPSNEYLETVLDLGNAHVYPGDITNLPKLALIARKHQATCIVHTAGLIGASVARQPFRGVEVNVGGTVAVAEAARLSGVRRLVFCSSMAVYDFDRIPAGEAITEESPTGPKNLYGATKLAGEHLLTQYGAIYGLEIVHLRLAGVFGRGQFAGGSWMGRILNRTLEGALKGESVHVQPEWLGVNEYIYVKDAAMAIALSCLAREPIDGAYNIGTGVLHDCYELIAEIKRLAPAESIVMAETGAPTVSYLRRSQPFDISKAGARLGFGPEYSLSSGLADYLDELQRLSGRYQRLA